MLDRFRALVPFVAKENKPQKESLQMQMVRKVMELSLAGGFHYLGGINEWFAVNTLKNEEKFKSFVTARPNGRGKDYNCVVAHYNPYNIVDILTFSILVQGDDQSISFSAVNKVDGGQKSVYLKKEQWRSVLKTFLESEVDKVSTSKELEDITRENWKYIIDRQVVVEWVRDMTNPQLAIAGFLNQK